MQCSICAERFAVSGYLVCGAEILSYGVSIDRGHVIWWNTIYITQYILLYTRTYIYRKNNSNKKIKCGLSVLCVNNNNNSIHNENNWSWLNP